MDVASFTDAWIETDGDGAGRLPRQVASFTDAWIETWIRKYLRDFDEVASFTDAWIETFYSEPGNNGESRIFYRCVD